MKLRDWLSARAQTMQYDLNGIKEALACQSDEKLEMVLKAKLPRTYDEWEMGSLNQEFPLCNTIARLLGEEVPVYRNFMKP